ncbi:chromosome segregation ATPase [Anabaena sp. FACHB-1237]|uniref:chromosome segregation ATPase n=1 Tax=Anabaena sp. FACHB-1237 TaxID=2692769 RepID=UPI0016815A50|nr:chromosome segregation ATPase [Anabaena sp. FACHB-1237]MBD2138048.1 chromosome segregation ATPase [Anabaena sp. FACHB-1237]
MSTIEPVESPVSNNNQSNWYLLTVRSKKREVFLKYLHIAIAKNQLQEIIIDIKSPADAVYQDIVLLNLSNFKNAYSHLKEIECFQNIERKPLQPAQVKRMLSN